MGRQDLSSPLEDLVFHTKSRKERLQDRSASLADGAATVADQLRERVAPAIGQAAESARQWGQPHVEAARHWAKPHVEHGIEIAAPRLESAVSGLAPKVDIARDKIVDELLPRVAEAITAWASASAAAKDEVVSRGAAAKDEVVSRGAGAVAVVSGDAVASPKRKKRGRVLMTLGLIGAAGAAATAFLKKSAPKDDPWATPLTDPYTAASNGRHSKLDSLDPTDTAGPLETAGTAGPLETADTAGPLETAGTGDTRPEVTESLDEAAVPDPVAPTSEADPAPSSSKD
ncbi:MAG: hypothetical protein ACYDDU_06910 [Dermatophilaceae bacterium]